MQYTSGSQYFLSKWGTNSLQLVHKIELHVFRDLTQEINWRD